MRWQQIARLAIAAFVIVFAAIVVRELRRPGPVAPTVETTPRIDPGTIAEVGRLSHRRTDDRTGKIQLDVDAEGSLVYPDGRRVYKNATVTLPDRGGHTLTITGAETELVTPEEGAGEVSTIRMRGGVRLASDDGLVVTSSEATFDEKSGMLTIPGEVQFTRGRMTGSGVGATYDRGRDVLWLLDRARVEVKPGEAGAGALTATAKAAGLARAEHYVRLTEEARVTTEGRSLAAREITIQLTPDDSAVQHVALRGDSRITGAAASGAAESMSAQDIDLTYAADGRSLQHARLMERASVQLGEGAAPGRQVAGRTIELGLAPDGTTVTTLNASERVQLDLPAAAGTPARRITSHTLTGSGAAGIETATFSGDVLYRELRPPPARGAPAAPERTGRSERLHVQTAPGLGAIQQADFRGQVRITDGATSAEGPRAIYRVAQDSFEIMPSAGDAGPAPMVNDGRVLVNARTIQFTMGTRKLRAETDVRSSLQPSGRKGQAGTDARRLPAMLDGDEPVNVTANALEYDGATATAVYTGDARLFQGHTQIQADTIVVDDRHANLRARGHVRTVMFFDEASARTGTKTLVQTTATGDAMLYEDAKRVATYTTGPTAKAHIVGTQGDVTAERIELFLKPGANELERAEADGKVVVKEGPRTGTGAHLTYTPADERYVMTGTPVEIEEKDAKTCRVTVGTTVTFRRSNVDMRIDNNGVAPVTFRRCAAAAS